MPPSAEEIARAVVAAMQSERSSRHAPARDWLSVDDVAQRLGVSRLTIYRRIRRGELPASPVGRTWRIRVSDVDGYLDAQRINHDDDRRDRARMRAAKKEARAAAKARRAMGKGRSEC